MIRGRKPNQYTCTLERVIDGDTVLLTVELGLGVTLQGQRIRLARIDAAELDDVDPAHVAQAKLAAMCLGRFLQGSVLALVTNSDRRDLHGRIIGEVHRFDPATGGLGANASDYMLSQRLARAFGGGQEEF